MVKKVELDSKALWIAVLKKHHVPDHQKLKAFSQKVENLFLSSRSMHMYGFNAVTDLGGWITPLLK
jgi:hypothetical protein